NTSHNFVLGASYERALSGAKDSSARANVVGGREFDILAPAREKGRTSMGAEYRLENKVGLLFNLKMDYGFNHGSDKKDIRFSTGLGYRF
ncbi:MAG: hypothetical protein Q4A58_06545, partial [Fusobacterium sp.]|uniref:hypothetical protein n=1 Tax=Fusobacterium sp. TaxID=68766 RepID=UPI0026DC4766